MPTVTLDTNVFPVDDLRAALRSKGFDFAAVSVTARETRGTDVAPQVSELQSVPETAVWDEGEYGVGLWGGDAEGDCFERALAIISNGSFPPLGRRSNLSKGERRQLRDAMILCAHVRDRRDIFVTNDSRAFIDEGRRERLQAAFKTRIMTRAEFQAEFCS